MEGLNKSYVNKLRLSTNIKKSVKHVKTQP